ncbi:hypothetical protein C8Q74DRAFT_1221919 [Fomes fomentarius]|nr:hypothetical protein C8Q74DRAFT_1221919 [Fomes fomentarius]
MLAKGHQDLTMTSVQYEVRNEEEKDVPMEVVKMASLEVLNGLRAQLPLLMSLKRVRSGTEDPKLMVAPCKHLRTQAYITKIKAQQEWLAQGFTKVKTALNRRLLVGWHGLCAHDYQPDSGAGTQSQMESSFFASRVADGHWAGSWREWLPLCWSCSALTAL